MKSKQSSEDIAKAMSGFNSTENVVFDFICEADFIHDGGLHHVVTSS